MSTPDMTPYVDLRVYDKDPIDVFQTALAELQSKLPEWTPREDNTEVMLLEALALEVSESVMAINRLPSAIVIALLRLYGISRDTGTSATATVTFELADTRGYTLPAGTRLLLPQNQGWGSIVLETEVALAVPEGERSGTVAVHSIEFTDVANGVPTGTRLNVLDNAYFVNTATLASPVLNGRKEETDKEWFDRGIQRFGRLTDTLVVPRHFELAATERPEVSRARALDSYNADASGAVGDHPGHLTLALYGAGGVLSAQQKADVVAAFQARKFAPLTLHTVDPVVTTVNVDVRVKPNEGYTQDRVSDAVQFAVRKFLNPESWPWKGTLYINELIGVISELPEVDYVTQLVSPSSNLTLNGVAPLAKAGSINVLLAVTGDV